MYFLQGYLSKRKGTTTERYPQFWEIPGFTPEKVEKYRTLVNQYIGNAYNAPKFHEYNGIKDYKYDSTNGAIIKAHDFGHNGCGPTLTNQDIAAFDPMFWFFHCNWDRLWWKWQVARKATDLESFQKTLHENDDRRWLLDPQMSISDPFGEKNSDSINITQLGIAYMKPEPVSKGVENIALPIAMAPSWRARNEGHSKNSILKITRENLDRVSLRVKGINRIKVPGSFWVVLYLGGEEVGRDAFFQSTFSGNCENCVAQAKVDFDFVFERSHLADANGDPKEIEVQVVSAITGEVMPFEAIGNPTINIRMPH
ncbi:MAG: tyrosinase family protein [Cyanobacteriota bacterium]|nr:tyrosinase family protein [Cyanobacteriota bacterium]